MAHAGNSGLGDPRVATIGKAGFFPAVFGGKGVFFFRKNSQLLGSLRHLGRNFILEFLVKISENKIR